MDPTSLRGEGPSDCRIKARNPRSAARQIPTLLACVFLAVFTASGILTLPQYGIGWDEGLGSLFFGERYLFYLASGQEKYLDFDANLASLQNGELDTFASPFREFPYEYPALVNAPSAGLMHLLAYRLGWMDPVDAFHLLTVLLAAGLLAGVYWIGSSHYGQTAALFGMLFLGLFPRLWGDMHFNSKDVPEMVFFGLAVLALLAWEARPTPYRALAAGLAGGAALAVKANAYFIPVVYALAYMPWSVRRAEWAAALGGLRSRLAGWVGMAAAAVGVFVFSWPYLYSNFAAHLRSYFGFVFSQGGRQMDIPASLMPLRTVVSILPEGMLVFLLAGMIFLIVEAAQGGRFEQRLLLAWLAVPVLRASLPDAANFDGIRHFMEFVPAAALAAGVGVDRLSRVAGRKWASGRKAVLALALAGLAVNTGAIELRYRGFEHLYYNALTGGFSAARQAFGGNEASDYWAVSYRAGLEWINAHAERGASLSVPVAGWLVEIPARVWLRPDLRFIPAREAQTGAEQPRYVMFIHRPGYYDALAERVSRERRPVHQIALEGEPILYIYRMAPGDPLVAGDG